MAITPQPTALELSNKQLLTIVEKQGLNLSIARAALEQLSRLGNGDRLGNSKGNVIAQDALRCFTEPKGDLDRVEGRG